MLTICINLSWASENKEIAQIQENLNYIWVMACATLVLLMQAGFMCLESGMAAAKHSINVAIKNMADFVLAVAAFWAVGFGLMFGETVEGWIGFSHFFISFEDPWLAAFFIFQAVFVGTAATIDSGAIAGRTNFTAYLVLSFFVSTLIYPVFGHWAWAGLFHDQQGWLEAMGFIDFAGSTVVHSVGGWVALAGVIVIGPRLGKFNKDGTVNKIPAHNMTLSYLGTFILVFGWFGFNGGSTLEASSDIAPIILNTLLAASFGCLSASALSWRNSPIKKPEGEMISNGVIGGLVSITAGCASVNPMGAVAIGFLGGIVMFVSQNFIEKTLKLDDVVGAIAAHGFCGAWGTIAVGIFMTQENLGEVSRMSQVGVQTLGVLVAFIWTFSLSYLIFKLINWMTPLRVSPEDEKMGLNISEHGATSTILDIANAMHKAMTTRDFHNISRIEEEIGTEGGDLAHGFNEMIITIQETLDIVENEQKKVELEKIRTEEMMVNLEKEKSETVLAHQIGEKEKEKVRNLLQELQEQQNQQDKAQEQYLTLTKTHIGSLIEVAQGFSTSLVSVQDRTNLMSQEVSSISSTILQTTEMLLKIAEKTDISADKSSLIQEAMAENKKEIHELGESAQQVDQTVKLIDDLSVQTKMLALNATITAARAGETGKSFAVVANEVQALAQRSADAVIEIHNKIEQIQAKTAEVISHIDRTNDRVKELNTINDEISESVNQQSEQMQSVSSETKKISSETNEVSNIIQNTSIETQNMVEIIQKTYSTIRQAFTK